MWRGRRMGLTSGGPAELLLGRATELLCRRRAVLLLGRAMELLLRRCAKLLLRLRVSLRHLMGLTIVVCIAVIAAAGIHPRRIVIRPAWRL